MRKRLAVTGLMVACFLAFGLNAYATPYEIGSIWKGLPFGDGDVLGYMNNFLTCPTSGDGCYLGPKTIDGQEYTWFYASLPGTKTVISSQKATYNSDTPSIGRVVPAGWEYLLAKYDGPSAGVVVYFLDGDSFTVPVNEPLYSSTGLALSGYWLFNGTTTVPDGGTTAALLGLAMVGLGFVRRLKG